MSRGYTWERVVGTPMKPKYAIKNELFAQENVIFKKACELAGVKNTTRMASKWRNKKGSAYTFAGEAKSFHTFKNIKGE